MKKLIILSLSVLFAQFSVTAAEIPTTTANFATNYGAANDGDVLMLAAGTYSGTIQFPTGKTITLKADAGTSPVFTGNVRSSAGVAATGGGLIFDGVEINLNSDYFIDGDIGNITILAFRNLTIRNVNRCLLRTNAASEGSTITTIEITNCIIRDCGNNDYNLIWPRHFVRNVIVKNSTLYNYVRGESLFLPNHAANTSNVITFTFENNTVYKWAKSNDRALCKTEGKYSSNSTYTFKNNIVTVPGVAGMLPQIVQTSTGTIVGENNLIVNYGGYTGGTTRNINDLTLAGLELETIGFPDPENGDFTILDSSPLATAGTGGGPIGDPRWIKTLAAPVFLSTSVSPAGAGTVSPAGTAAFEAGKPATVSATKEYGFKFKEWQINGVPISTQNPYTFDIMVDTEIVAVFEPVPTYTLTINNAGDGANWGRVRLIPEPVNGVYEENTVVNATIIPNSASLFLYWDDMSSALTKTVHMTENKEYTATFDWVPFIVGWDFEPNEPRNNRPGDYYNQFNNQGIMRLFNGNGSSTNWGASNRTFGGVTYNCARRYTGLADMMNPRYIQVEFSASDYTTDQGTVKYKTIQIKSFIAADNGCVHRIQKMQYAFNAAGPYIDLVIVDMTGKSNQWIEFNATLPDLTDVEKERIFIRWVGDKDSDLLGTANDEGFYLANVFVFAELEEEADDTPPVLNAIVPGEGTSSASANGAIVLTFNKRVVAGNNEGRVTFNGKEISPVFSNRTVSYPYTGLNYGTQYTFTLPAGAITDVSGNAFDGTVLTFSTMTRPQPVPGLFDAVVAKDGTGDYTTIQAAVEAAPLNSAARFLIFVKDGLYEEAVTIAQNRNNVSLIGQSAENTIVSQKSNGGVSSSIAALIVRANNFYAENMTFQDPSGPIGPAPAHLDRGRFNAYKNVRLLGMQDTQVTGDTGLQYYQKCYIEGTVDFICGGGTMFYDRCEIFCLGSEVGRNSGSCITAPATAASLEYGYVFSNCTIRGGGGQNNTYRLGRPWNNRARAVYLNTTMIAIPHPEGWADMGTSPPGLFAEYNSMNANGVPIDLSNRKKDFYRDGIYVGSTPKTVLTAEEAAMYTIENVLTTVWSPLSMTESTETPVVTSTETSISWEAVDYAICYIVLCNDNVVFFTLDNSYVPVSPDTNLKYSVYAVSFSGALSAISNSVTLKSDDDDDDDDDDELSDDATLKSLTVSSGTLSPAFAANITEYTVNVANNVTSITVIGVANHAEATVVGNVTNKSLTVGNNEVILTVTAEDGSTEKIYTVTVIRADALSFELNSLSDIIVYPNPVSEIVNISGLEGGELISFFDVSGRLSLQIKASAKKEEIEVANLPKGTYFVKITKGNAEKTVKIVVN